MKKYLRRSSSQVHGQWCNNLTESSNDESSDEEEDDGTTYNFASYSKQKWERNVEIGLVMNAMITSDQSATKCYKVLQSATSDYIWPMR